MFLPASEWLIFFIFLSHQEVFEILSESYFFDGNVTIHSPQPYYLIRYNVKKIYEIFNIFTIQCMKMKN